MENQVSIVPASYSPEALIAQGIEKGIPVETMERLLAMRKELRAEAAKEAYDEAMAGFQGECPLIEKDKDVEFSGRKQYSYAPMDSIVRQLKGLISKYGFSYTFKLEEVETISPDGKPDISIKAICIVKHKAGHSDASDFTANMKATNMQSSAQATASKATYAKRQAFCNAFGITTGDEDVDALKTRDEAKNEAKATPAQHDEIKKLGVEAKMTVAEITTRVRELYGISILDITSVQAMGIIASLKKKISTMSTV